jgi:hypothetical protein
MKNKQRVLMIVAYPNDEVIFGLTDILQNDTFVVCVTHGNTPIRSLEFEECKQYFHFKAMHLKYPDNLFFKHQFKGNEIFPLNDFDCIVSHNEYTFGDIIHKHVHQISKRIADEKGLPFYTFDQRCIKSCYTSDYIKIICEIYSSQNIKDLFNHFNPF